ncbi:MAG: SPOR domain-containing protein [Mariprofundaceae bacterium]|nr:SPOR domain-containing protein [Mariprofundaceae bacterium]
MAKRDFAHVHTPVKRKGDSKPMPALMLGISLLFTGILAFGGGYMVGHTNNSTDTLQAEKAVLQTRIETLQKEIVELQVQLAASVERAKPAAKKAAAERVGDLTFYSELPRQKVMPSPLGDTGPAAVQKQRGENVEMYADLPPPVREQKTPQAVASVERQANAAVSPASQASASPAAGSPDVVYKLQVGSFIRRSDAEVLLNRMALAGIKATVSEAQVPNMGTRYRVFTTSVTGMAQAEGIKSLLREKLGIKGLLMRER